MRLSLNLKIVAVFLAVGIIPLIFTGYVSFETAKNALSEQITSDFRLLGEAKEDQILTYLNSLETRTIDFSSDGFIRDSAEKIQAGVDAANATLALNAHLALNKRPLDPSIVGVFVIGNNGTILASTEPAEVGMDERKDEYFLKGKLGADIEVTSEEHKHFNLNESIIVSAPLVSRTGARPMGVIVDVFNVTKINEIVAGTGPEEHAAIEPERRSEKTETFIVDSGKRMIFHTAYSDKANRHYLFMPVDTVPVRKCLEENSSFTGEYANDAGARVFGSAVCIPGKGWTLVIESDRAAVFAPIASLATILLSLIVATALLIIAASWILARTIASPIEALTGAINEISTGKLDAEIAPEIKRSEDEIGDLARAFDRTIASLKLAMLQTAPQLKKQKELVEAKHVESSEKFRQIFDLSPEVIVLLDTQGRITDANPRVNDWIGYSPDELMGKKLSELPFLPPLSKAKAIANYAKRVAGFPIAPYELEFTSKEGKLVVGRMSGSTIKDCEGKTTGSIIMINRMDGSSAPEKSPSRGKQTGQKKR